MPLSTSRNPPLRTLSSVRLSVRQNGGAGLDKLNGGLGEAKLCRAVSHCRSRRFTIGLHEVWTPEEARREAKVLLGQVAEAAEERKLDREAITVKELRNRYLEDLRNGLVLGKRGRPKKPTTISTDVGRKSGTSFLCSAIDGCGIWQSPTSRRR